MKGTRTSLEVAEISLILHYLPLRVSSLLIPTTWLLFQGFAFRWGTTPQPSTSAAIEKKAPPSHMLVPCMNIWVLAGSEPLSLCPHGLPRRPIFSCMHDQVAFRTRTFRSEVWGLVCCTQSSGKAGLCQKSRRNGSRKNLNMPMQQIRAEDPRYGSRVEGVYAVAP
ncbi:hypothetical protein BGZ60DRAFT_214159 [Tricladium varicosporioides]|nr:hypothetical protein BGZ60DRAFT_214159 [Hymenoscyphus varicosporioides]